MPAIFNHIQSYLTCILVLELAISAAQLAQSPVAVRRTMSKWSPELCCHHGCSRFIPDRLARTVDVGQEQQTDFEGLGNEAMYTVDDALEEIGFGAFQVVLTFLCGIIWFADAGQFLLLSSLSFILKCQWELSSAEEAVINSAQFVGAFFGSLFWGVLGDTYGRKKAMIGMVLVSFLSGILSAQKLTAGDDMIPGYLWILLCRFGIGFASSCIPQVSTYYIEFLPRKTRAACSVFISLWWSLGTVFSAGLGAVIMGKTTLGWHWYLGLTASPMVFAIILVPFLPESARFYVVKGNHKGARKVLDRIAWFNCKSLPEGRIVSYEAKYDCTHGNIDSQDARKPVNLTAVDLNSTIDDEQQPLLTKSGGRTTFQTKLSLFFVNGRWRVTVLLIPIWIGTAWLYYGNILLASTILVDNPHCAVNGTSHYYSNSTCKTENFDDYLKIMWTAAAEIPAIFVTIFIIELIGRKLTLTLNYALLLVGLCLLFLCPGQALLAVLLCWIRGVSDGIVRTMYVYTNEVYPTAIRGLGVGAFNSLSRIGASLTPYIAQVLFEVSDYATIGVYAGFSLVLMVIPLMLPVETKGLPLKDER